MSKHDARIDDVTIPNFLYGTAWKEEKTQDLTALAISAGFRGIDTANQRRHYFESAVGAAVAAAIDSGRVSRDDLFLQTKFTFRRGQDHRLPYDPGATISEQVEQSFAKSLQHLQVERIDSYLLHGPSTASGLGSDDWAAWGAMETLYDRGHVRMLGVSNVSLEQLRTLCKQSRIRPHFVQNRCFASRGWDCQVRDFCREHAIAYQGFSLLTANRDVLTSPELADIANRHKRSAAQIIFRFAMDKGMIPLTGTSNFDHMQADLNVSDIRLDPAEVAVIATLGER